MENQNSKFLSENCNNISSCITALKRLPVVEKLLNSSICDIAKNLPKLKATDIKSIVKPRPSKNTYDNITEEQIKSLNLSKADTKILIKAAKFLQNHCFYILVKTFSEKCELLKMSRELTDTPTENELCAPQTPVIRVFNECFKKYPWINSFQPMDANNSHGSGTDNQFGVQLNPFIGLFRSDVCSSQNLETDLPNSKKCEEKLPDSNQLSSKQLRQNGSENNDIKKDKTSEKKEQYLDDGFHDSGNSGFTSIAADTKNDKICENKEQFIADGPYDSGNILIGTAADIKNYKIRKNKEQSKHDCLHDSGTSSIDIAADIKEKLNENKKQYTVDRFRDSGKGDLSALCKKQNNDISNIGFDLNIMPTTPKLECFESNQTLISIEGNNVKNKILAWEKLSKTGISKHSELSEFCVFKENHSNREIDNECMKINKSNLKTMKQNNSISIHQESFIPVVSEENKSKVHPDFAVMCVSPKIADLQATLLQKMKEDS